MKPTPTTDTTATTTATGRTRRGSSGHRPISRTPQPSTPLRACPEGNDQPCAVAIGSANVGRSRATASLHSPPAAPPRTITVTTQTAVRRRPATHSPAVRPAARIRKVFGSHTQSVRIRVASTTAGRSSIQPCRSRATRESTRKRVSQPHTTSSSRTVKTAAERIAGTAYRAGSHQTWSSSAVVSGGLGERLRTPL